MGLTTTVNPAATPVLLLMVKQTSMCKQVWIGVAGNLRITQTTMWTGATIAVNVVLWNLSPDNMTNVYYMRTLNPQNEAVR